MEERGNTGGTLGASEAGREDLSRRTLLLGAGALGVTAASYAQILGSNDRILIGQIGAGNRGRELASVLADLKDGNNFRVAAVCDLWAVNRERAVQAARNEYGLAPQAFQYFEDLLAVKDLDAVIVATPDFQHAPMLKMAADAGKDAYVEKPMGNVLEEARAARDAVRAHKLVVQVGTQHRSEPYQISAREWIARGRIGDISKVEVVWNYHGPRWRGRPEVKRIREADTDWKRWLMHKSWRPFDPRLYFEFRLYRDFSSGIPDQWMSHGIDLVHFMTGETFPTSVVAHGGVYAWHDGRENPDTFQALLEYPKGFLVSYATSFGNDCDSSTRFMGDKATLINFGGEGSQRWKAVEEKGTHESNPFVRRGGKTVTLNGRQTRRMSWSQRLLAGAMEKTVGPMPFTSDSNPCHMRNWLECLRSRKDPNATVDHGFSHSVACIMAARAQREGRKLYWDAAAEEIRERPVAG